MDARMEHEDTPRREARQVSSLDIAHRIGIRAPIGRVYAALATLEGIAGWWTRETTGASRPGGTVRTVFRTPTGAEVGTIGFDVVRLSPDREVRWRFTAGPEEWIGTEASFALSQDGDLTLVVFGHERWPARSEFMAHCSMKWATFLLSLKGFVEEGKGRPSPDDLKIDDWN